jgi:hypothetical protein
VEVSTFDIASDAFASFKDILTKHKQMTSEFLDTNYEEVSGLERLIGTRLTLFCPCSSSTITNDY